MTTSWHESMDCLREPAKKNAFVVMINIARGCFYGFPVKLSLCLSVHLLVYLAVPTVSPAESK